MYESISKSGGDRTCSLCVVGQIIVHIPDSSKCSESILMRMIDRLLIRGGHPTPPHCSLLPAPTSIYSQYGSFHQGCLLIPHDSRGRL